ncbi:hypothetical protein QJS10_CPA06g01141 [Acorus calamus]|uniref:Uncharacterized protein n=1 Tax=Acorus calamus TaxID=4465 RepID=A0AAV9EKK0_ACOCL|nr:hypothetical protein QJS10_CPA06g01141 [Acorus calamus]
MEGLIRNSWDGNAVGLKGAQCIVFKLGRLKREVDRAEEEGALEEADRTRHGQAKAALTRVLKMEDGVAPKIQGALPQSRR